MPILRAPTAVLVVFVALLAAMALAQSAVPDDSTLGSEYRRRLDDLRDAVRKRKLENVSPGTLATLEAYIYDARRMREKDPRYHRRISRRIGKLLDAAEQDRDPIAAERGLFWRGYRSRYSIQPQMYSIYVPEDYDPEAAEPLVVTLHGGSSNHNVWLALCLGNGIKVDDYWKSHRKRFRAKRHPDGIVVAPDGLGQVRWRWMGEQDVLDVIADVRRNYNIDADKIVLTGLSNGGIGSYTIGLKHAWRFAAVLPLAGVTDWTAHHEAEGRWRPAEEVLLENESAITYAENAANTHLRFYHGLNDPGFDVEQARLLHSKLRRLGVDHRYHEFEYLAHDLKHVLWRKLLVMRFVQRYTRKTAPQEVRLVTASSRANRQHWLVLDERIDHLGPARLRARVSQERTIEVETHNAERFTLLLDECPVLSPLEVYVDGQRVYRGPAPPKGRLTLSGSLAPTAAAAGRAEEARPLWRRWDGSRPEPGTRKVAGLSGPLGDVMYEPQVHVYGTQVEKEIDTLREAARVGARAWIKARAYSGVRHPVIPDSELTEQMMRRRAVFLYGNAASNSVLAEIGDRLPIRVGKNYIEMRGKRIRGWLVGARFVCPNPLEPSSYLVVAAGQNAKAVEAGERLPIYLGDYIVYNGMTTRNRAFMILGGRREIETGFFTEDWKLPPEPPPRRL